MNNIPPLMDTFSLPPLYEAPANCPLGSLMQRMSLNEARSLEGVLGFLTPEASSSVETPPHSFNLKKIEKRSLEQQKIETLKRPKIFNDPHEIPKE